MNFLSGYRTYIIAAVTFALGGLAALGYHVPPFVFGLLTAAGLTTARLASSNTK